MIDLIYMIDNDVSQLLMSVNVIAQDLRLDQTIIAAESILTQMTHLVACCW